MRMWMICFGMAVALGSCDRRDASGGASAGSPSAERWEDRLLDGVELRRSWQTGHVKIWLQRPAALVRVEKRDGTVVEVHAWGANENDYNVPMMRLDVGEKLYELTAEEWERLRGPLADSDGE